MLGFDFFEEIPDDVIGNVMKFLDPYSFKLFVLVNKRIFDVSMAQVLAEMYKNICITLFPSI